MALPKRKHSKSRRDKRRGANSKVYTANLSVCPQCKSMRLPHRVCPFCGYYNGKPVIVIETKQEKKK
ncbi:MAG: 50S ribosomal protein L32 [Candidatus Omnitrophica bacterium]|nr:50S ribosomal protein L32 [Candidatus Omnitrophota bacterium]MDD5436927.1 50S ribosomal protein L32 [Candidatus Omnitrophota bacterium]